MTAVPAQTSGAITWWRWTLATVAGFVIGAVAGIPLGLVLLMQLGFIVGQWSILIGPLAGALAFGATIGLMQWLVFRHVLRRAGWWILVSALCWPLIGRSLFGLEMAFAFYNQAATIGIPCTEDVDPASCAKASAEDLVSSQQQTIINAGLTIAAGSILGLLQGLVLRARARSWGLWILVNALFFAAVSLLTVGLGTAQLGMVGVAASVMLLSPLYGAVTGLSLDRLLKPSPQRAAEQSPPEPSA